MLARGKRRESVYRLKRDLCLFEGYVVEEEKEEEIDFKTEKIMAKTDVFEG